VTFKAQGFKSRALVEESEVDRHMLKRSVSAGTGGGGKRVILEGWLKKKSLNSVLGRHMWQSRYFVLFADALLYFKKKPDAPYGRPGSEAPLGVISTDKLIVEFDPQLHNGCRFAILHADTLHACKAESATLCRSWVDSLRSTMADGLIESHVQRASTAPSQTKGQAADFKKLHVELKVPEQPASSQPPGSQQDDFGGPKQVPFLRVLSADFSLFYETEFLNSPLYDPAWKMLEGQVTEHGTLRASSATRVMLSFSDASASASRR